MNNKVVYLVIIILFFSCNTKKSIANKQETTISVIKFMYSNDYAIDIDYVSFWQNTEEHAKLELFKHDSENFLKRIKSYPKGDGAKFEFIKYAFIVKHSNITDTIYADLDLDTWMITNNGTKEFYDDDKREFAEDLQSRYGFFKSCW